MEKEDDTEISGPMIEAGEKEILYEVGGADLGGRFSARDLAVRVYRAMREADLVHGTCSRLDW